MIQTINQSQFIDAFSNFSEGYQNKYSYEGKVALFDYLEAYEQDTGTPVELDIIAICCDFTEFENFDELKENYRNIETMDELKDKTHVIELSNGRLIIQNF